MPQRLPQITKEGRLETASQDSLKKSPSLAFVLPASPETKVHLFYTQYQSANVLLLSVSGPATASNATTLGSFVYALPDVSQALPCS